MHARYNMDVSHNYLYIYNMHDKMLDFHTNTAVTTVCAPNWNWKNPGGRSDEVNLWLVTQGSGIMEIGGSTYQLGPGSCFFIRMGEPCHGRHDPRQPLTVMWSLCQLRRGWPAPEDRPLPYRHVSNLPFLSQLYGLAIRTHHTPQQSSQVVDLMMKTLFLAVEEEDRNASTSPDKSRLTQVQKIAERIRSAPGNTYAIPALARECACSPGHFSRLFEAATGMAPRTYITHSRIVTARSLLRGSSHKIAHIAGELGYADIFHFSRQFKEKTGVCPSDYRDGKTERRDH